MISRALGVVLMRFGRRVVFCIFFCIIILFGSAQNFQQTPHVHIEDNNDGWPRKTWSFGLHYGTISSLVLTADMSALPLPDKEPDGKPVLSGYNYGSISSLILTADRSALPRRDNEPDAKPGLSGYNYGSISSLILTADRSALPR